MFNSMDVKQLDILNIIGPNRMKHTRRYAAFAAFGYWVKIKKIQEEWRAEPD